MQGRYCTVYWHTKGQLQYIFKLVGVHDSLKKAISNVGTAKVIVCAGKPFKLVYLKSKEQLKVIAHFGFWNVRGVAQYKWDIKQF